MNTVALTKQLDKTALTRETRSTKNGKDIITFYNNTKKNYKVKINNSTTYNKLIQICILGDYIYINHQERRNLHSVKISTITSISVSLM